MSKGDRTKHDRKGVGVSGPWFALPCDFLESRACASLSPLATKMLLTLLAQVRSNHWGNGRLDAHPDTLKAHGWTSVASARAALSELIDAGIVVCTRQGARGRIGLYGITLFPMHCDHSALDVGPGAWSSTSWQIDADAVKPPTTEKPAQWSRPRRAEKRIRTPRSGNESSECVPATGMNPRPTLPCIPATGTHTTVSPRNAFPPRDSPLRVPSVASAKEAEDHINA